MPHEKRDVATALGIESKPSPEKGNGTLLQSDGDASCDGPAGLRAHATDAVAVLLWISLSVSVILQNKWILHSYGFPFPITLTMAHMAFGSVVTCVAVKSGWMRVDGGGIDDFRTYSRCFGPIAALFAITLWAGNSAYLFLSVPFIQMLKATMPVAVFLSGCCLGTEIFQWKLLAAVGVITVGIGIASAGEVAFVPAGVCFQLVSIVAESIRLGLIQLLLKDRKLNPLTTTYYLAPAALACLTLLWTFVEARAVTGIAFTTQLAIILLFNATTAFALNLSVFWLIVRTSALTMNVAGGLKDLLLIGVSCLWMGAVTSTTSMAGYALAMVGAIGYKRVKARQ